MRIFALLLLGLVLASTNVALAQTLPNDAPAPRGIEREPVAPGPSPQQRGEEQSDAAYAKLVDALFDKLKEAKSEPEAETIDDALTALWVRRGGTTAELYLTWAQEDFSNQRFGRALDYLDAVITLQPDNFEAYYRRAIVHFQQRDLGQAITDLGRTLALEPRHYGALGSLGTILSDIGREEEALKAFKAAHALIPLRESLKKQIDILEPKIEGRPG